ncbi:MAG: C40 family peptidase [Deltaproteobacteria bacterium]|nr:C40 family peptidase [Deltaproteobacteria bacterium]
MTQFIGIPFKPKGRSYDGVDCWGLVWLFARDILNIKLPSYSDRYLNAEDQKEISTLIKSSIRDPIWTPIGWGSERFGDFVLMRILGDPWHVGVVVGGKQMLHIMKGINSCLERYTLSIWRRRIINFYRHEELL